MEAYKSLKFILKFIGLRFVYSESFWYRSFGFICWFFVLSRIYPVGKYVITSFDDVTKFAEVHSLKPLLFCTIEMMLKSILQRFTQISMKV